MVRRLFRSKFILFLVIATVLAAVIIGVLGNKAREVTVVENVGGSLLSPAQSSVTEVGGWFSGIAEYFGSIKGLKAENERLKNENTNLNKQLLDMKGLDNENKELRKMLQLFERETRINMIAASVISKDPTNWYSTFTINCGSDDGVKINQPVVNSNRELVGQILRVGKNWAEVVTILDPQSSIGAMIKRSKEIGIIEGNSYLRFEGKCRLGYIARDTDVKQGDYIETSGLGGIFPKGLVIGIVTEVYDENSTMSKVATVEPLTDISKINEVFVVTDYTETDLTEEDYITEPDNNEEDVSDEEDDSDEVDNLSE